jgi:hypothetical protein
MLCATLVLTGWGLVPNDHLDQVEGSVDTMIGARSWLWSLITFMMVSNVLQLGQAVVAASALDPTRMLKIYGGLSSAGLHSVTSTSLLLSMYGIYYDAELGLPVVNYVPGWAYVQVLILIFVMIAIFVMDCIYEAGLNKQVQGGATWEQVWDTQTVHGIRLGQFWLHGKVPLFGLLGLYTLFWIIIPLCGYVNARACAVRLHVLAPPLFLMAHFARRLATCSVGHLLLAVIRGSSRVTSFLK